MDNKMLHGVAFVLVIVGALNWGLAGLGYDVVHLVLGTWPTVEKVLHLLVGLSAVVIVVMHPKTCIMCSAKKK